MRYGNSLANLAANHEASHRPIWTDKAFLRQMSAEIAGLPCFIRIGDNRRPSSITYVVDLFRRALAGPTTSNRVRDVITEICGFARRHGEVVLTIKHLALLRKFAGEAA